MSGFLLAVNSFAWFVFIANGNSEINADVISWDIAFLDEEEQVELLDINLEDLYPGMASFSKDIVVKNRSDLNATFTYEIENVVVYGVDYKSDDLINSLENDFPFSILFSYDKTELDKGDKLNFRVTVNWPFESSEEYYKLNSLYPYLETVNYYVLENGNYVQTDVSVTQYKDLVETGLYVESDDADTYWGERSVTFKQLFPNESAIVLKVKLVVTQDEVQ